jgi:hypothetical protein
MSGGSYNYLEISLRGEPAEAFRRCADLAAVRDRLLQMGYAPEAKEVDEVVALIGRAMLLVETRIKSLAPILHAVEWRDSMDWGDDDVRAAVEMRRASLGVKP